MKYIANSPQFTGDIIFSYDGEGFLSSLEVRAALNEKQWHWLSREFPVTETMLKLLSINSKLQIAEVLSDLSFSAFWDAYKYKVGNRAKTETMWNALTEPERIAALQNVPKYLHWLACRQNTEQALATTWLSQRRWENEFSKK